MKQFNLETALAGEPVLLRNGHKAILYYCVPDKFKIDVEGTLDSFPVKGMIFDKNGCLLKSTVSWRKNGKFRSSEADEDIIGMWEEPEMTQEELFKKALKERLPLRYEGLDSNYANVYVVAKSMSDDYILEWKDGTDSCLSLLGNLPKFKWYLASEKPVKETGTIGLPKPFIPKQGEEYFSVSPHYDRPESFYANYLKHPSIKNGNCFKTEEDAQKWIDFMKSRLGE